MMYGENLYLNHKDYKDTFQCHHLNLVLHKSFIFLKQDPERNLRSRYSNIAQFDYR